MVCRLTAGTNRWCASPSGQIFFDRAAGRIRLRIVGNIVRSGGLAKMPTVQKSAHQTRARITPPDHLRIDGHQLSTFLPRLKYKHETLHSVLWQRLNGVARAQLCQHCCRIDLRLYLSSAIELNARVAHAADTEAGDVLRPRVPSHDAWRGVKIGVENYIVRSARPVALAHLFSARRPSLIAT